MVQIFLFIISILPSIIFSNSHRFNFLVPIQHSEEFCGVSFVNCIYVINLDRREDRWCYMQSVLDQQGLHATRVSAVDGLTLSDKILRKILTPKGYKLRYAEVGCFLSHITVWKDALARGFNTIWIMEDDVLFEKDLDSLQKLLDILYQIDPQWDILYTDHQKCHSITVHTDLQKILRNWGTHSMIISTNGLQKLLSYAIKEKISYPVDTQLRHIPGIRQYQPTINIVAIKGGYSSDIRHSPKIQK